MADPQQDKPEQRRTSDGDDSTLRHLRVVAEATAESVDYGNSFERLTTRQLTLFFDKRRVLHDVNLSIPSQQVTTIIGPTGGGKTSLLRCFNRMNDLIEGARVQGEVLLDGSNIYEPHVDAVRLRKRVGMVAHQATPFPTTIFENVAYAPRVAGTRDRQELQTRVRSALQQAGVWDEMRNRLDESALRLSYGQQYRLCIARSLAAEPEVLLMDEPTLTLDPADTARVEDLIFELKEQLTVVLVTNNIQQAARISDRTAFLLNGQVIEAGMTTDVFTRPKDPRTEDYVRGRFG